jgi:hypothetical protein
MQVAMNQDRPDLDTLAAVIAHSCLCSARRPPPWRHSVRQHPRFWVRNRERGSPRAIKPSPPMLRF